MDRVDRVDSISFCVHGEPKGKGRPRFTKSGHAYTPRDTAEYEEYVKAEYLKQCRGERFGDDDELVMFISAYYKIPDRTSKKKLEQMVSGQIRPIKKPDTDNIIKIIADSLNGLAYKDDSRIVSVVCTKYYGTIPRVVVRIERN